MTICVLPSALLTWLSMNQPLSITTRYESPYCVHFPVRSLAFSSNRCLNISALNPQSTDFSSRRYSGMRSASLWRLLEPAICAMTAAALMPLPMAASPPKRMLP